MKNKLNTSMYALMIGYALSFCLPNLVWAGEDDIIGGGTETLTDTSVVWYNKSKGLVDWSASVGDPALGGVQLPGSRYRNVKEAYNDTLTDNKGYNAGSKELNPWKNAIERAFRSIESMQGTLDRLRDKIDNLNDRKQTLKEKLDDLMEKMAAKGVTPEGLEEKKKRAQELCRAALAADDLGNGFAQNLEGINCDTIMEDGGDFEKYRYALTEVYPEVGQAIVDYRTDRSKVYDLQKEYFETKPKYDATEHTLQQTEKRLSRVEGKVEGRIDKLKETLQGKTDTLSPEAKQAILSDIEGISSTSFDQQLSNPAQRLALQRKLDYLSDIYGLSKMDLSTPAGRASSKFLIETLQSESDSTKAN